MDVFKISAKMYAARAAVEPGEILAGFHRWIVAQSTPGHTWIDVADYSHVQGGPGVVLVGIEANVSVEQSDGTWGVVYTRKQPWPGVADLAWRLRKAVHGAAQCAGVLAGDPLFAGRIEFATDRVLLRLNDRLEAPNSERTLSQVRGALTAVGESIWGAGITIEHHPARLALFEAIVRGSQSVGLTTVLGRLVG
jgi:hypothetical protein